MFVDRQFGESLSNMPQLVSDKERHLGGRRCIFDLEKPARHWPLLPSVVCKAACRLAAMPQLKATVRYPELQGLLDNYQRHRMT